MSEALRLAEWLDDAACGGSNWNNKIAQSASELRRLHAENERLRESLRQILPMAEDSLIAPELSAEILDARAILK